MLKWKTMITSNLVMIRRRLLWGLLPLLFFVQSRAAIRLPAFISSDMVLQQQASVPLWGWAAAGREVTVYTSWDKKTYTTTAAAGGQWRLRVATPRAGGPYTIRLADGEETVLENVLVGEVWLCSGQSNMEIPMEGFQRAQKQPIQNSEELIQTSENRHIRLFTVQKTDTTVALDNCSGRWQQAGPAVVKTFSAVAYQYARMLHETLKVPVGIIASSWGGTPIEAWMSGPALNEVMANSPQGTFFQKRRNGLYHAMIHPLKDFAIRGFLWYQGESNKVNAPVYDDLMTAMVKDWRRQWNDPKLPFYFVQVAPLDNNNKNAGLLPALWEAQARAEKAIAYSGMAVINDAGEQHNIHPADKTTVARRLCLLALNKTYGYKGVSYSGPVYRQLKVRQDTACLYFDHAGGGLVAPKGKLTLFEVAGADSVFHAAEAVITPEGVSVHSRAVPVPVAVRYAFKDWFVAELYNREGLPASSFRTDNW